MQITITPKDGQRLKLTKAEERSLLNARNLGKAIAQHVGGEAAKFANEAAGALDGLTKELRQK